MSRTQTTLSSSTVQVVEGERGDDGVGRPVLCPDCGKDISASHSGGKPLPDDAPADSCFGWSCDDCQNTVPSHASGPKARGFVARMTGIKVRFRGGHKRWVAVSRSEEVEEGPL